MFFCGGKEGRKGELGKEERGEKGKEEQRRGGGNGGGHQQNFLKKCNGI